MNIDALIEHVRQQYRSSDFIPLHEPRFAGREKEFLSECIDSTFVSSIGAFVDRFETELSEYVGASYCVAAVNGTAALHAALVVLGVDTDHEVITQPLTFVATCNAIKYCGAEPIFVDTHQDTLSLDPQRLEDFLIRQTVMDGDICRNRTSGKAIRVCVPMHTFGHAALIDDIEIICGKYNIVVLEDAAEALGSRYRNKHLGTFGLMGVLSFNGNKIITSGGGGAIVTDDEELYLQLKHITTTAKTAHAWEYQHDKVGFNYRMPNINAALACAQLENLENFVLKKRELASIYADFCETNEIEFVSEPEDSRSNYWLNAVICKDLSERDELLKRSNEKNVMMRPVWGLMNNLPEFANCEHTSLSNSTYISDRIVNIPSSVPI